MQRWTKMCVTAGMAVLVGSMSLSPAMAQPPGGGRGGRGGFGSFGGGQTSVFTAIRAESVQKELTITDEQKTKLTALGEEVQTAMRGMSPMREQGAERPSAEDREKQTAEMRTKMDKLMAEKKPALAAILSAEQMTRLDQIVLQSKGGEALTETEIQAKLAVTDEQKAKIAAANKEFTDKQREAFRGATGGGGGGFDREAMTAAMEKRTALTKERDKTIVAVLTPVQAEQFEMMKGKEFDVASLRMGGGRGPGGPGGNRPNRPATEN